MIVGFYVGRGAGLAASLCSAFFCFCLLLWLLLCSLICEQYRLYWECSRRRAAAKTVALAGEEALSVAFHGYRLLWRIVDGSDNHRSDDTCRGKKRRKQLLLRQRQTSR